MSGEFDSGADDSDGDADFRAEGEDTSAEDDDIEHARASVRETFDYIAGHFSKTRAHAWPEVEAFLEVVEERGECDARGGRAGHGGRDGRDGDLALDLGCGNGRHAELLAAHAAHVVGVDVSRGLLAEAQARFRTGETATEDETVTEGVATTEDVTTTEGVTTMEAVGEGSAADGDGHGGGTIELVQGDAAVLPVRDDAVHLAVYVATLHHLPDRATRVESLDELARVLEPRGRALVSAWSTVHDRFDRAADEGDSEGEEDTGDEKDTEDEKETGGEGEGAGFDTTIDWTLPDGERVARFYHIYDPDEFETDLAASAVRVVESWVSSGNCYAVVAPP